MINSNSFSRNLIGSFGALVLGMTFVGAATAPANAATVETATSVSVSYSDLNLSSTAGQNAFAARVRSAAKAVCANDFNDIASRTAEQNCVDAAVAGTKLPVATNS